MWPRARSNAPSRWLVDGDGQRLCGASDLGRSGGDLGGTGPRRDAQP